MSHKQRVCILQSVPFEGPAEMKKWVEEISGSGLSYRVIVRPMVSWHTWQENLESMWLAVSTMSCYEAMVVKGYF